ncbi:hypothetical protein AB0F72_08750 [Actinoplanes sp. NPDC023936]|uniref:hypothetical protein n=1 Tax=Actinoplanes sp. NPDC023936 TaxID=3154910 RepID=UPI0033C4EF9C
MSTPTLAPPTNGPGDWDEFLEFAATVRDFDREALFDGVPAREHRPHRSADKRAAITESLREGR